MRRRCVYCTALFGCLRHVIVFRIMWADRDNIYKNNVTRYVREDRLALSSWIPTQG